jgi:hypothetical protein
MAHFLNKTQVTAVDQHRFIIEASDIGLRPGLFPEELDTDLGNRQQLYKVRHLIDEDNEFLGVVYKQRFGTVEVHVLND